MTSIDVYISQRFCIEQSTVFVSNDQRFLLPRAKRLVPPQSTVLQRAVDWRVSNDQRCGVQPSTVRVHQRSTIIAFNGSASRAFLRRTAKVEWPTALHPTTNVPHQTIKVFGDSSNDQGFLRASCIMLFLTANTLLWHSARPSVCRVRFDLFFVCVSTAINTHVIFAIECKIFTLNFESPVFDLVGIWFGLVWHFGLHLGLYLIAFDRWGGFVLDLFGFGIWFLVFGPVRWIVPHGPFWCNARLSQVSTTRATFVANGRSQTLTHHRRCFFIATPNLPTDTVYHFDNAEFVRVEWFAEANVSLTSTVMTVAALLNLLATVLFSSSSTKKKTKTKWKNKIKNAIPIELKKITKSMFRGVAHDGFIRLYVASPSINCSQRRFCLLRQRHKSCVFFFFCFLSAVVTCLHILPSLIDASQIWFVLYNGTRSIWCNQVLRSPFDSVCFTINQVWFTSGFRLLRQFHSVFKLVGSRLHFACIRLTFSFCARLNLACIIVDCDTSITCHD